jgi:hypothetical protein
MCRIIVCVIIIAYNVHLLVCYTHTHIIFLFIFLYVIAYDSISGKGVRCGMDACH